MLNLYEIFDCLKKNLIKFEIFNCFENYNNHIFGISTDSRTIQEDELFLALEGKNKKFDGHDFIEDAIKNSAKFIIFEINKIDKLSNLINLNKENIFMGIDGISSLNFYGLLANFYRKKYLKNVKIIGITGSVGKTTIKNIFGHCLSQMKPEKIYFSHGNFNNFIGVPFNIFKIPQNSEFAILELGMNSSGEISYLSKIVEPDIVIISNVSPSHIGAFIENQKEKNEKQIFLRALKKIAFAKAEIFDGLSKNGLIILNRNLPFFKRILEKAKKKSKNIKIYDDKKKRANIFLKKIDIENNELKKVIIESKKTNKDFSLFKENNQISFSVDIKFINNLIKAFLPLISFLEFSNDFILEEKQIGIKSLENFDINKFQEGRGNIKSLKNIHFIDESYNAGFDSILASIETLKNFQNSKVEFKRKILVLGSMGELGDLSNFLHLKFLKPILNLKPDILILIGEEFNDLYKILSKNSLENIYFFEKTEDLLNYSEKIFQPFDLILLKGRNSLNLNKIFDLFY